MAVFGDRYRKRLHVQLDAARVAVAVSASGRVPANAAQRDLDTAAAGLAASVAVLFDAGRADEVVAALAAARAEPAGAPVAQWHAFIDGVAAELPVRSPSGSGRRFCTRCGSTVMDGAQFCEECGAPVSAPPSPLPANGPVPVAGERRRRAPVIAAVVCALLATAAFGIWLLARGDDDPVANDRVAATIEPSTAPPTVPATPVRPSSASPTALLPPPDRAAALRALLPARAMGSSWRESAYVATDVAPLDACGTGFTGDEGAPVHVGRTVSHGSTFVNAQVTGFGPGGAEAAVDGYVRSLEACTEYHNATFDKDVTVTRAPQVQVSGDTATVRAQLEFRRTGTTDVTLVVEVVVLRRGDLVQTLLVSAAPPGPSAAVTTGAVRAASALIRSAQP
jgi:hypothetical protein